MQLLRKLFNVPIFDMKKPRELGNPSVEMYLNSSNNSDTKTTRKILGSPFRYIPNCRDFKIDLGKFSQEFLAHGIIKRENSDITILPYRNGKLNRFAFHQILRLKKKIMKPSHYWRICWDLMKRSNVFRVMAINHVYPQWQRKESLGFILNQNRKLSKLVNSKATDLLTTRIWIPKPNSTKLRPLGVPSPDWRLYLHLLNNFLFLFVKQHIPSNQHGFFPGRGTLTAWQQFFRKKLYNKKYIYEYDFQQYFDSINLQFLGNLLVKYQLPNFMVALLVGLNLTRPQNVKTMLEKIRKYQEPTGYGYPKMFFDINRNSAITEAMVGINMRVFPTETGFTAEKFRKSWLTLGTQYVKDNSLGLYQGVAQGAPTSPLLASLALNDLIKRKTIIQYADDGFICGNTEKIREKFEALIPKSSGIKINEEKSKWVKYNGEWLRPLKFLGLEFDGKTFKANTRKGSQLEITPELLPLLNLEKLDQGPQSKVDKKKETWEDYFCSKLMGFFQARLYSGDWNLSNWKQSFQMSFVHNSWMTTKLSKKHDIDIFNSSSFACYSLVNMMRWNSKLRKPRKMFHRLSVLRIRRIPLGVAKAKERSTSRNR